MSLRVLQKQLKTMRLDLEGKTIPLLSSPSPDDQADAAHRLRIVAHLLAAEAECIAAGARATIAGAVVPLPMLKAS